MGVARVWIIVAEEIGYEAFMTAWRILNDDPGCRTARGIEVNMRTYDSFLRYQRNRVIETLTAEGKSPTQIRLYLLDQLCEKVSLRHIRRLCGGR